MENIYLLSDANVLSKIGARIKSIRLKQNITQESLANSANISLSSVKKIENGEIKSFDSFLRVLRVLGKLEIFHPLIEEEQLSPSEYYELMNSVKKTTRRRAAGKLSTNKKNEEPEW